jgi:hypothetical protein
MTSLTLYDYLARNIARDVVQTILARLIKAEALIKLNLFSEAISLINGLNNCEQLPHILDDCYKKFIDDKIKYTEYTWNSSKPIYDLNNLKVFFF